MHLDHDPNAPAASNIDFEDFLQVDVRAGTIVSAEPFPKARHPAFKLLIDFGLGVGLKKSSARITELHSVDELVGKQVLAVVNFPPRQIGPFLSEVLVLGVADQEGAIVLVAPEARVPNGARLA